MIIPVFVPNEGCPVRCSFCDQHDLTDVSSSLSANDVSETIARHLETIARHLDAIPQSASSNVELAFYGGSFTMLPLSRQASLLEAGKIALEKGIIGAIRVSTRPDGIDNARLDLLASYGVTIVEIGVQSMDTRVLEMNNRGHTPDDTRGALSLLKARGFVAGVQVMPGLPGDSAASFITGVLELITLKPDMARIYPAVVMRNTELEKMYLRGDYTPLSLYEAVDLSMAALLLFQRAGIPVIRIGLQASRELDQAFVAGPCHPAFRQMVDSAVALAVMCHLQDTGAPEPEGNPAFVVNPRYLSTALGQKKNNLIEFGMRYNQQPIFTVDSDTPYGAIRLGDRLCAPESLPLTNLPGFA